ncbi:MAG: biopolymer transporter ExbD [Myxococcales bacterium]|nr:biopolymer transporter ExbD [Myxococcales bacterium]
MTSFYPPAYQSKSPRERRVSERPSAHPGQPREVPSTLWKHRPRVRTVQPQGMSETTPSINMTPLIDVVLVLLLVFMAVSPKPVSELDVQLVQSSTDAAPTEISEKPLLVTLEAEGIVRLNDRGIPVGRLADELRSILASREPKERVLYVVASDDVGYAALVETLDSASRAGTTAIGFVTDATP